jgi:hypothetical protein
MEAGIAGGTVEAIPCYECEYDLRGIPESAAVPSAALTRICRDNVNRYCAPASPYR